MSERLLPLRLIREAGATAGAELGVWRGDRAFAILEETPIGELILVDPWAEACNRFPTTEPVPLRMTPGQYHCTMGEGHQDQGALNAMADAVRTRALDYGARARVVRLPAVEAAACVADLSLDFVLWDAVHLATHVAADLAAWTPKVRPGGCVMGDGFSDPAVREGVMRQVGAQRWFLIHGDFWQARV